MDKENKYQIVYSRRIMYDLIRRGFVPVNKIQNPEFENFSSWLFEDTEEFHKVFEELTNKKVGDSNG